MIRHQDTYFLSSEIALKTAEENNRSEDGYTLQVCYYAGDKIESDLVNLIHLPIDNLSEDLANSIYRIPTSLNLEGFDFSQETIDDLVRSFNFSFIQAKALRKNLNEEYYNTVQSSNPNFEEELRFYILANTNTRVMQHMSRNIAKTLENMGYCVLLDLHYGCEDTMCLKNMAEFNPHATININHLCNSYIGNNIYNFVWIQDVFGVEGTINSKLIRKRDNIFHLIDNYGDALHKANIKSTYQSFCIDSSIYKKRNDIVKKKKVVFLGSSYHHRIKDIQYDKNFKNIYESIVEIFEEKSMLNMNVNDDDSDVKFLMDKYNKPEEFIGLTYGYILRDYCVEKLCSIDTEYEIEVYGDYWDNNEIVRPFHKGFANYGEDISKIYNEATYGYCVGGYVLMQRTLECACSETIPLVLDTRSRKQDNYDKKIEDSMTFFNINNLEEILKKDVEEKSFEFIRNEYSYQGFVQKFIDIINK